MTRGFNDAVWDDDDQIVSFVSDGVQSRVGRDNQGRITTLTEGVKNAGGTTTVIEYDASGRVSRTLVAPYANGLIVAGPHLLLDGKIWRGMGVCYYDAIDHPKAGYTADFLLLASYGVPCIRVGIDQFAAGNSPTNQWRQYFTDKALWYKKRDDLVAAAEAAGIGIIFSFFWRHATIPDLMLYNPAGNGKRDAVDQWGVADSYTRKFMRQVTTEMVERYKGSPATWGWEIGNEWHNSLGQPYGTKVQPGGTAGGPVNYSVAVDPATANGVTDIALYPQFWSAFAEWAALVKKLDPSGRLVSSGLSQPSTNIYNEYVLGGAGGTDTYAQWMNIDGKPAPIFEQGASGFNCISAHIYEQAAIGSWYFNDRSYGVGGIIGVINDIAKKNDLVFFLGEFGAITQTGNGGDNTRATELLHWGQQVESIISNKVPLSLIWNYGYLPNVPGVKQFNIDPGTTQEYQLRAIAGINARIQKGI